MQRAARFKVLISRHSYGEPGARGIRASIWSEPEEVYVYAGYPTTSEEVIDNRSVVSVSGYTLITPLDLRFGKRDRVEVPGVGAFEVQGKPAVWKDNPHSRFSSSLSGLEVKLQEAEG